MQRSFTCLFGFIALLVALFALPSVASAANSCDVGTVDKTWVGNTSSDWFTNTNWSPSGVPGTATDVCIPASNPSPNPAPVIGTGATASAASIESFEPIEVNAGTLRVNSSPQPSLLHEDLDLAAGTTLDNRGSLTIQGNLDWSSATITSGGAIGTVTIASTGTTTATVPDTQRTLNHQTLHIDGTGTFAGNDPDTFNDDTYLQNAATLEIGSGGSLDLQGDQDIHNGGGTGTNSVHVLSGGTLSRSSGTLPALITTELDNDGTVSATAASTLANPALSLQGGSGTQTSSGQFNAGTGAVLEFNGGTHKVGSGGSFTGAGTIHIASGEVDTAGTVSSAAATKLALSNATLSNTGTLTVNGTFDWGNNATISGAGTTTLASTGTLTTLNGDCTSRTLDTQTLNVNGNATFEGATAGCYFQTLLQNGATLNVGSGGNLDLQDDQQIIDNGGVGNLVHVLSGGTLKRTSAAGTTYAEVTTALDNDGTVSSSAGTLRLSGGSGTTTSTGQFSPATAAVIEFGSGTYSLSGSSFGGAGTTRISGGEVDTAGTPSVDASSRLELSSSILANTGTLTVNGTLDWGNGSTISGAGTTTIASTGSVTTSNGDCSQRTLDTQTMNINGNATFEGATAGCYFQTLLQNGATLNVGSGGNLDLQDDQQIIDNGGLGNLVHVLSGGTLKRTSAAGTDAAIIQAPLDNDGTVTSTAGTIRLTSGSGGTTSTGQFSPASGTLIEFASATYSLSGSSFGGAGTTRISGGEVDTAGSPSVGASSRLELGTATLANAGTLTINGTFEWGTNSTISGAGTTTLASTGTLTTTNGDCTQRTLDTQTLNINGNATFEGATAGCYFQTLLQNGAKLNVGSGGNLDLQDDQQIIDTGGAGNLVHVLSGGTLKRTSAAGTDAASISAALTNDGTIDVTAGLLRSDGTFTNYNQTTDLLSGGTYAVRNGSTFRFTGADVKTNGAELILDGAGSGFEDESATDGLRDLASNNSVGKLRLRNGRNFARTGAFTNNGLIDLAPTTKFTTTGSFTQGAGGTLATEIAGTVAGTSYGQLAAGNAAAVAGTLSVTMSYVPHTADVFDVVTAGTTRTGTFATVNGQGFDVKYLADRVRLTAPSLVIGNRTLTEGDAGTTNARFRVDLSSPSAGTVTVDYATADGSAKAPGDYTTTTGTLTFTPGQVTKFIDVPIVGDTLDEVNERYTVALSNSQFAGIADGTGTGRITDDDAPPAFSINDASHAEGGQLTFNVSLSGPSAKQTKIHYATANGTATAPADYASKSGTLTFAPGTTTKTVKVSSAQDTLDEDDEAFAVNLSSPTNATIADGAGTGTITDNDPAPSFSINDASRTEGSAVSGFLISLSAPSGKSVTVTYTTLDGTAKAPGDYTAKTANVTFTPGQTSKSVSISTVQDTVDEDDETFTVRLSNPTERHDRGRQRPRHDPRRRRAGGRLDRRRHALGGHCAQVHRHAGSDERPPGQGRLRDGRRHRHRAVRLRRRVGHPDLPARPNREDGDDQLRRRRRDRAQ